MSAAATLARLCRALGVSAPDLTQRILDRWPALARSTTMRRTKAEAERQRKGGDPMAFAALATFLPPAVHSLGIDPGRKGAMVGLDESGAVVIEVALGSLMADESLNGPAARKRARAEEQARIREANKSRPPSRQLKGRRKRVTSQKGARMRLDPLALRWLFEHVRPAKVALEGLLYHGIALRSEEVMRLPRFDLVRAINRAREGVKAGATMQANWERLAMALRYAGLDYDEVTPSTWQAGWSSASEAGRLSDQMLDGHPGWRGGLVAALEDDPKARSIAAAALAGYDCGNNDALADAYGLARWGMR